MFFMSVVITMCYLRIPVDSILEAVVTVSPNRQYLGMVKPTTPATQGPLEVTRRQTQTYYKSHQRGTVHLNFFLTTPLLLG